MNRTEVLNFLTAVREHLRAHPKGDCKLLSIGDFCRCGLCQLDNAIAVAEIYSPDTEYQLKLDVFVKPVKAPDFIELKLV